MNNIARRIARIEVNRDIDANVDLRSAILDARQHKPTPTHTVRELERMSAAVGFVGRIARGWLRIGFVLPSEFKRSGSVPTINPNLVLPAMAGFLYSDPLAFALFTFDFGNDRALRVVQLPEAYRHKYDSEFGIEEWAANFFEDIAAQVRDRAFDGAKAVDAIRHAVSSGHGISKSATTAMLVNWLMTTRPNARGVVTANTAPQLESKTWAELAKWTKRSVFSEWFDVTTGRGSMKMVQRDHPESWNCFGQTAAEERAESFAGLHAADSSAFMIFDEASAIPAKIWDVSEGAMTDGEPFFFAFGNPTRTSTKFFECFNGQRHRWTTRQVDSRQCQLTNKKQIEEWIADFGLGSDFVKVRVLGVFPSASSLQFIERGRVDEAMARDDIQSHLETLVVGVDPARFGDDSSVIWTRAGRDARSFPPIRLRGADTMTLASRVAEHVNTLRTSGRLVILNIDGGGVGGGVVDRLRQLGYDVNEIQFGGKAFDSRMFANRRAEIWGAMKEWLAIGTIPKDESLATDLTSVEYGYNAADAVLLERKESMKSRGLASPDSADALALTFAVPVPIPMPAGTASSSTSKIQDYDPIENFMNECKRGGYPLQNFA